MQNNTPDFPDSFVSAVNNKTGNIAIQGTSNRVTVSTSGNTITLSTPQDIAASSSPTFAGLVLNGALSLGSNQIQGTTTTINFTNFDVDASGNVQLSSSATAFVNTIAQVGLTDDININADDDAIIFTAGGRTFVLPTSGPASQTICTDGVSCASGGGVALLLAPSTEQTDSSTNAAINVDKTGASGNLIELTVSSAQRFTVDYSGNATVAGNINATAGSIQTGGTTRVDNSGNLTNIGNITATGTLSNTGNLTATGTVTFSGGQLNLALPAVSPAHLISSMPAAALPERSTWLASAKPPPTPCLILAVLLPAYVYLLATVVELVLVSPASIACKAPLPLPALVTKSPSPTMAQILLR